MFIKICHDVDLILSLDAVDAPCDAPPSEEEFDEDLFFVAYVEDVPAGYIQLSVEDACCSLTRVMVLPQYRGKGLQRSLTSVLLRQAERDDLGPVLTYTSVDNPVSLNNLLASGFKAHRPDDLYAGEEYIYLIHQAGSLRSFPFEG